MPQKHTFRASKGDGGFNHERRPGRKGVTGFIATKQCTRYSTNAPDSTPLHWQLSSAMPPQAVQCPRGTNAIAERTPRPIIPHAIPTQPDPTPTRNPQNSNDLNSIFERVTGELHAKLLSGGGAWPGFETTRQATQYTTSAAGVKGAGGSCRGARGRWRGLAGLRDDSPSHPAHHKRHRCGGRRRELPRCRWAVAGPGRASRRRAERSSRRGRLAGGPPPTGTHSGRALRRPEH